MASQIASLTIVCWTVYSGADQRKHQSSTSLAFVRGIHRWLMNSPQKRLVRRKMFPFDDVIMVYSTLLARSFGIMRYILSNVKCTHNVVMLYFYSYIMTQLSITSRVASRALGQLYFCQCLKVTLKDMWEKIVWLWSYLHAISMINNPFSVMFSFISRIYEHRGVGQCLHSIRNKTLSAIHKPWMKTNTPNVRDGKLTGSPGMNFPLCCILWVSTYHMSFRLSKVSSCGI